MSRIWANIYVLDWHTPQLENISIYSMTLLKISFNLLFIKYLQVQVLSTHEDMFSVGNVKVTFKDGSQFEAKFPSKRSNFHSKIVTAKYYSRLDWLEKDVNDLKNYLRRCQCSSG